MRTRTLSLKKETVSELTTNELGAVAGAAQTQNCTQTAFTCDGPCHSDFAECITGVRCILTDNC